MPITGQEDDNVSEEEMLAVDGNNVDNTAPSPGSGLSEEQRKQVPTITPSQTVDVQPSSSTVTVTA